MFSFNACQLFTSKKAHSIEQQTDSIIAKSSPRVNLAEGIHLLLKGGSPKLPLDSIVVEMVNNTDSTCVTGEAYTIEQRVNDVWTILPIKPRKDGAVYPSTILATNSLHTAPACSLSMLSLTNTTLSEGRYTASPKSSSRKGRRNRKASIVISKQNDSESVNRASPPSSTSPRNSSHASAAPSRLATKSHEFLNIICSCSFAESKGQPRYITSNLYPRFFSETIEIEVSASSILRR